MQLDQRFTYPRVGIVHNLACWETWWLLSLSLYQSAKRGIPHLNIRRNLNPKFREQFWTFKSPFLSWSSSIPCWSAAYAHCKVARLSLLPGITWAWAKRRGGENCHSNFPLFLLPWGAGGECRLRLEGCLLYSRTEPQAPLTPAWPPPLRVSPQEERPRNEAFRPPLEWALGPSASGHSTYCFHPCLIVSFLRLGLIFFIGSVCSVHSRNLGLASASSAREGTSLAFLDHYPVYPGHTFCSMLSRCQLLLGGEWELGTPAPVYYSRFTIYSWLRGNNSKPPAG